MALEMDVPGKKWRRALKTCLSTLCHSRRITLLKLFSIQRFLAVMIKEFIQMRRDRVTIAMLVSIPLIQLVLFGFAINVNPRHLPTMIVSADHSPYTRAFISALQNTKYFQITNDNATEQQANYALSWQSVICGEYSTELQPGCWGKRPQLLLTAVHGYQQRRMPGGVSTIGWSGVTTIIKDGHLFGAQGAPFEMVVHAKYNPESITQYNIAWLDGGF